MTSCIIEFSWFHLIPLYVLSVIPLNVKSELQNKYECFFLESASLLLTMFPQYTKVVNSKYVATENISKTACILQERTIVYNRGTLIELLNKLHKPCTTLEDPIFRLQYTAGFVPFIISKGSDIRARIFQTLRANYCDAQPFDCGFYLFESMAFLKNSDNPNCEYFIENGELIVITTRTINEDEKLTIDRSRSTKRFKQQKHFKKMIDKLYQLK
jgi:hypothetical protein